MDNQTPKTGQGAVLKASAEWEKKLRRQRLCLKGATYMFVLPAFVSLGVATYGAFKTGIDKKDIREKCGNDVKAMNISVLKPKSIENEMTSTPVLTKNFVSEASGRTYTCVITDADNDGKPEIKVEQSNQYDF